MRSVVGAKCRLDNAADSIIHPGSSIDMYRYYLIALTLGLAFAKDIGAQLAHVDAKLLKSAYRKAPRIGGASSFVSGYMIPFSGPRTEFLRVFLPSRVTTQDAQRRMCIDVVTADGNYDGTFEATTKIDVSPLSVRIRDSRYDGEISKYRSDEILVVVRAKGSQDCVDAPSEAPLHYLATWSETTNAELPVVVLRSGGRLPRVSTDTTGVTILNWTSCKRFSNGLSSTRIYVEATHICTLDIASARNGAIARLWLPPVMTFRLAMTSGYP